MSAPPKYRKLDKADAAVLLVDHQSGLCNIVGDFSPDDFKNSILALADLATDLGDDKLKGATLEEISQPSGKSHR